MANDAKEVIIARLNHDLTQKRSIVGLVWGDGSAAKEHAMKAEGQHV
jgi:hypothetical protein